jgi:hypothetical protein
MTEQPYEAEARLQNLLALYPDLLPGDQIDDEVPRRWLLVAQEVGIPDAEAGGDRWSLDHLFLDQDGTPTFVEVKRSSDTRIRREVVGQLLEYAANARYWRIDRMRELFGLTCEKRGADPIEELRAFLGVGGDPEEFWISVRQNLNEGRVRLLFVADVIPAPLKATIEFLNRQMNPAQVLGVEIRQFRGGAESLPISTFVPRVLGYTEDAKQRKDRPKSQAGPIDEDEFYSALSGSLRASIQDIAEYLRRAGYETIADKRPAGELRLQFVLPESGISPFDIETRHGGWFQYGPIPAHLLEIFRSKLRDMMPSRSKQIESAKDYVMAVPLAQFADSRIAQEAAEIALWVRSILVAETESNGPQGS